MRTSKVIWLLSLAALFLFGCGNSAPLAPEMKFFENNPTLTSTVSPTETPIPTITPSATITPSPTLTPTPAPTQIGGTSGSILLSCTERTGFSTMYSYSLQTGEYSPVHPEFMRSLDNLSLWTSDKFIAISPEKDLVIWEKCEYKNVITEGYPPKIKGQEMLSCQKYVSTSDFITTVSFNGWQPTTWIRSDFALLDNSQVNGSIYVGNPLTNELIDVSRNNRKDSTVSISPNGEYVAIASYKERCVAGWETGCLNELASISLINTNDLVHVSIDFLSETQSLEKANVSHITTVEFWWREDGQVLYIFPSKVDYQEDGLFKGKIADIRSFYFSGDLAIFDIQTKELEIKPLGVGSDILWIAPRGDELFFQRAIESEARYRLFNYSLLDDATTEIIIDPAISKFFRNFNKRFWGFTLDPQQKKFVFDHEVTQSPSDFRDIYLVDLETGNGDYLMTYSGAITARIASFEWSPDGNWLLVHGRQRNNGWDEFTRVCMQNIKKCVNWSAWETVAT